MRGNTRTGLIKPRWSKVISDLWDNKMRTLLVVASIAVGVFSIGAIASAYAILAVDIHHSYASTNPVNVEIWMDPFYEDFERIIERVPGVENAEGRRIFGVRGSQDGEVWKNITLIVIPDHKPTLINQLVTLDGTRSFGRRDLLVSRDFMNDTGFQVGDMISLELPDGSLHTLPLVGIVADQATGAGNFTAGPKAYLSLDTLETFGLEGYFNRLYVTVEGDGADQAKIETIQAAVEEKIEANDLQVYRSEARVTNIHPMASMVLAMLGVLGALGGLITVLSSSLIINTLNALLVQHMRQIGVMKLIGGRSLQILGMYLTLIFAYGLIALAIAVPSGAYAGFALARFIANMMNANLQGFRLIPIVIGMQALIAFLIPLGAGFFPVNKGSKINVRRAISNDRPGAQPAGLGVLDLITRWVRWVSRPILLSVRNTFRQKGRLLLTIFTLTIAGAIFIAVFNVRVSMAQFMNNLMLHFLGDITMTFSQPYPITRIEKAVLPIPGVTGIEGWGGAAAEIWDEKDEVVENFQIIAPPVNTSLLEPDIVAGRWLRPGERKAVVVSDTIYEYYPGLQPGDTIRVKVPGQRVEPWTVVGVFRFISMIGDTLAYADFDFVADLLDLPNQSFSYRVITTEHTIEEQRAISKILDQYLRDRGFNLSSIEAGQVMREDSSEGINILVIFLLMMALLTAFVGSIGLTGTMGMNVLERTREIGIMRAIGAVDLEIIKSVVIEGMLIGLMTWVLAIGLSFPISKILLSIISETMMGSAMDLSFTVQGIIIWLGVVIFLSFTASILPARNAARLTIQEVLAYE